MRSRGALVFLLLYKVMFCTAQDPDCPYRECECDDTEISCDSRGLFFIPKNISAVKAIYTMFDLTDNEIYTVAAGVFPPNLHGITFLNNPITTIEDAAFSGSENTLVELVFSKARFTRIPDAFLRLKALTQLEIYETNIVDWNVEAMKAIGPTVTMLTLDTVGFSQWPDWIQYYSKLSHLAIGACSISSIPDNAFDHLTNTLVDLALYSSKLTEVPKAISNLTALDLLTLSENRISDVTWLPKFSKLSSLSLNNNSISNPVKLSEALRPYTHTLTELYLQLNKLTSIPELEFLKQIDTFDLSNNRISNAVEGSVPNVTKSLKLYSNNLPAIPLVLSQLKFITDVELSSNSVREIHGVDFPPSPAGADFRNNLLTELTDTSFPINSSMTYILLQNNPIARISISAFENLPQLGELFLGGTKLVRLPLALTALKELNVFDVTDTTGLICTCEEKSLEAWVRSLKKDNVKGDCGIMSVYDFYVNLSSDCPDLSGRHEYVLF